jgi:hypothetical protein
MTVPWTPDDAERFNRSLTSRRQREMWAGIANETLARTNDEGRAVHAANSALKPRHELAKEGGP